MSRTTKIPSKISQKHFKAIGEWKKGYEENVEKTYNVEKKSLALPAMLVVSAVFVLVRISRDIMCRSITGAAIYLILVLLSFVGLLVLIKVLVLGSDKWRQEIAKDEGYRMVVRTLESIDLYNKYRNKVKLSHYESHQEIEEETIKVLKERREKLIELVILLRAAIEENGDQNTKLEIHNQALIDLYTMITVR